MQIVLVHVHVKPEAVEEFKKLSLMNASNSVREPGVERFDVIQQSDDPTRFILIEIYRTPEAPASHKETSHYKAWRDGVVDMMAEPRTGIKYAYVFATEEGRHGAG